MELSSVDLRSIIIEILWPIVRRANLIVSWYFQINSKWLVQELVIGVKANETRIALHLILWNVWYIVTL